MERLSPRWIAASNPSKRAQSLARPRRFTCRSGAENGPPSAGSILKDDTNPTGIPGFDPGEARFPRPTEGILLAHFIVSNDVERSRRFYRVSSFLNIRVADIHAVYSEWTARGADFLTPPIQRETEIRCYMRDPDGYLIEVGQTTRPPAEM